MSDDRDDRPPIVRTPAKRRVAVTPPPQPPTINFETLQQRFADASRRATEPIQMPIGKFRGVAIADIPDTSYLCWLVRAQIIRSPRVAAEVERVHDARCGKWHAPERDEEEWR